MELKESCYFRESFWPLKLINLVGKLILCHILLNGQLELPDNSFFQSNFEGYIRDRDRICESALNFQNSVLPVTSTHEIFDFFNNFNDIFNFWVCAFSPDHVANSEFNLCLALQDVVDFLFIIFLLLFNIIL